MKKNRVKVAILKEDVGFKELEKFGYYYLQTCYCKDLDDNWVVRVDKKTRIIKCRNYVINDKLNVDHFIKDLKDAGFIEKVVVESEWRKVLL